MQPQPLSSEPDSSMPQQRETPMDYMFRRMLATPLRPETPSASTFGQWLQELHAHALPALDARERQRIWQPVYNEAIQQLSNAVILMRHSYHHWQMPYWYKEHRSKAVSEAFDIVNSALAGLNEIAHAAEHHGCRQPGQLELLDEFGKDVGKTMLAATRDYAQYSARGR